MDIIWYFIYFVTMSKTLAIIATIVLPILVSSVFSKRKRFLLVFYPVFFVLAFLNIFFGSYVGVNVVHAFGEKGSATITGTYGTSTQYNDHQVVGYNVLLKTAGGKVIETRFEDDDFNIYPPENGVIYPDVDDHFTVYYLRWFPTDFVMVDNDDSPWATSLRCRSLQDGVQEANAKYEFDRGSAAYRAAYIAAIDTLLAKGCVSDATEIDIFHQDIRNIEAGQP
jgi:hypothetical protein